MPGLRHRTIALVGSCAVILAGVLIAAPPSAAANGTWTIAPVSSPTATDVADLDAVSCLATNWCTAVSGTAFSHWDGNSWATSQAPAVEFSLSLKAVSCSSTTWCVAVGEEATAPNFNPSTALASYDWNGTSWSAMPMPIPSPFPDFNHLNGVSCTSQTFCVAVGSGMNAQNVEDFVVEMWDGSAWTMSDVPADPAGPGPLNAVSCTSSSACMAVGANGATPSRPVAYGYIGTGWTELATPPAGAVLNGVSCIGTTCEAVGNNGNALVADRWNGSTWSGQSTANPAGTDKFLAVSCSSLTSCFAVGTKNPSTSVRPLIERYNGSTWTILNDPAAGVLSDLEGVSCLSATACVAVGGAFDAGGNRLPMVQTNYQTQVARVSKVTVTASKPYVLSGDPETYTAKVSGTDGTGTISFFDGAFGPTPAQPYAGCSALPLTKIAGVYQATCTTTLTEGTRGDPAVYTGGGLYLPSVGSARVTVFTGSPPLINLPDAAAFKSYSSPVYPNAGSDTWSVIHGTLPPGLKLATNGTISGTPTAPGAYSFYVVGISKFGSALLYRQITVTPLTITPLAPLSYYVDQAFSVHLAATGGKSTLTWSLSSGALPPGVALSTAGVLSGAITVPGTYSFVVGVHDSLTPVHQTATATVQMTAMPMAVVAGVPSGKVGKYYSAQFKVSGGKSPYTWSVASGTLPPGLKLSANGYLTGIPTVSGYSSFTVQVVDSASPHNVATDYVQYFYVAP